MKKFLILSLLFGLFPYPALGQCSDWEKEGLWLVGWACLEESVQNYSDQKKQWERRIKKGQKKDDSFQEQQYFLGAEAWTERRFLDARNHWVRAAALMKARETAMGLRRLNEISPYLEWLEVVLEGEMSFIEEPEKTAKKPLPQKKRSPKKPIPENSKQSFLEESVLFMEKARLAAQGGQFHLAIRMARLAGNLNPDWNLPKQKEKEWRNLMRN